MTLLANEIRKSRKRRPCWECGRTILPGEHYRYQFGDGDGSWDMGSWQCCEQCDVLFGVIWSLPDVYRDFASTGFEIRDGGTTSSRRLPPSHCVVRTHGRSASGSVPTAPLSLPPTSERCSDSTRSKQHDPHHPRLPRFRHRHRPAQGSVPAHLVLLRMSKSFWRGAGPAPGVPIWLSDPTFQWREYLEAIERRRRLGWMENAFPSPDVLKHAQTAAQEAPGPVSWSCDPFWGVDYHDPKTTRSWENSTAEEIIADIRAVAQLGWTGAFLERS